MKDILLLLICLTLAVAVHAQHPIEFQVVDYTKGYFTERKAIQQVKIQTSKKSIPLASADWDGDGVRDTLFYRNSLKGGNFATVVYFDKQDDDWVTLYKYDLNGIEGTESIWFIEEQFLLSSPQTEYVIYTGFKDDKSFTVIQWDSATKKPMAATYKVAPKNLFHHKLVSNKAMIVNQNGASAEEYEEIPIK